MTLTLQELGLPSDVQLWVAALLTLISCLIGILGGFIGLALGNIRLPVLLMVGIGAPTAAGTNIIVSTSSAFIGAIHHLRNGKVDRYTVLVIGVPSMVGAFIGGFSGSRVPESLLLVTIGILVFWQGIEFIRPNVLSHKENMSYGKHSLTPRGRFLFGGITIGSVLGIVGGAVGLILGTLRLPAMIRILGVHPRRAIGTNLSIGFMMGLMGWIGHLTQGNVDYPLAVLMGTSGMAGSYLGARLTGQVSLTKLNTILGLVMLLISTILIWQGATR